MTMAKTPYNISRTKIELAELSLEITCFRSKPTTGNLGARSQGKFVDIQEKSTI
jgi:hypothetical protein